MRLFVLTAVAALLASAAQPDWVSEYASSTPPNRTHDMCKAIIVDNLGNCYVAGDTQSRLENIKVVKFSSVGQLQWHATLPESSFGTGQMGLGLDAQQNPVLGATIRRGYDNGLYVAKFRKEDGERLWSSTHWNTHGEFGPGVYGTSVAVDASGGTYFATGGRTDSTGTILMLYKYTSSGTLRWTRALAGRWNETRTPAQMVLASDGSPVVCGYAVDDISHTAAYAIKHDTAGNLRWDCWYRGNTDYYSKATSLAAGAGGVVYVTGEVQLGLTGRRQMLLLKVSAAGDTVWSRTDTLIGNSVAAGADNALYVVGNGPTGSMRTWKYSQAGVKLWTRDCPETDLLRTYGAAAVATTDGSMYAVGHRLLTGPNTVRDFRVLRYSTDGQLLWDGLHDTNDTYRDSMPIAASGPANTLYIGGTRYGPGFNKFLLMKYNSAGAVAEPGVEPVAERPGIGIRPAVVRAACRITAPGWDGPLVVADRAGRVVRTLDPRPTSVAPVFWDLCDGAGRRVADGVYFILAPPQSGLSPARLVVTR